MKNENKVLACVDQSIYADYVTDYAAWAAQRMQAPLELLHIIDRPIASTAEDHSGSIGFDAKEALLDELSEQDEQRSKAAREEGRSLLNHLRERALTSGIAEADMRQRHGDLEDALVEQQLGVRLYVLGRRGASADTTQRDLGRNVERVVRALNRPVLTVTQPFSAPQRILIAFDGGIVTRRGVEMVAASPLFKGLPVHLLMSGKASSESAKQLDWAQKTLSEAGFETLAAHIPGDTEKVIADYVRREGVDLLIMGAYPNSVWRNLFFGSTTTELLRAATIPTLLLR
ncbi:MAG: universal stress protein [Rhodocyclaceae bacterium]|nr:universal stress protein [Rhodocyclaceae bacterium]